MNPRLNFKLLFLFCMALLSTSCVSRKSIAYFQGLEASERRRLPDNIEIKPDDLLTIRVSAPEQAAALPFNLTKSVMAMGQGGGSVGANVELETYMVSNEGTIEFPVIGTIMVEGLTSIELAAKIKEEVLPYLQDPIVNVRILNFQISVLGEVASPGTFPIEDDHISLSKALGFAGDVLLTGKRTNILVMREEDGVTTHAYLDLTNADIVSSPFYNLQQNDVVYVEPIGPRIQSASYLGTAASYLSVVSVITSLILIFTR
ncbi:polysaccharide biosynthesis/export family protein [Autumnicola psychrophila]|uniref:Polysaccharide biosynthesis/export family protein n=1 Tax=Autumnicola psychrophila TaxID=3075592 RepID=A0ABU3DNQ1_9FLAO|nr:polysaccharide biosynthesis/export family protein [Zunongwangia sp. F225]MDT0685243.1 polysaccharide biosynthesis/export family protein [Zunongwangia sp. F225]